MSAEKNISNLLGIPQRILALLLNVKRSQLAMYEWGERPLNAEVINKMTELVEAVQTNKDETIAQSLTAQEKVQYHAKLKKLLEENDYQQVALVRTIEALEKKCKNRAKMLQLLHHYDHKEKTETQEEILGRKLLQVASNAGKKNVFKMLDHQIQLKFLQQQAQVLRKELGE
jgi:hypothetical protein